MSKHKLGDLLAHVRRPGKVPKSEYLEDGEFPVIDPGQFSVADYTNNSEKVSEYLDGDITWIVLSDITKNDCLVLLHSERKITERGLRKSSAKLVPANTILMTSRASVGFFALMDYKVCTNQGFINIIPHDDRMRMYLLFNLMSRVEEIRSNAKGTTYPEISKGPFRDMAIVVPPMALANEFAEFANRAIRQIRVLKKSTLQLTQARDLLLPRLMIDRILAPRSLRK